MANYRIVWQIEVDDFDDPEEAAQWALDIMRDPESIATCFNVIDDDTQEETFVDLLTRQS